MRRIVPAIFAMVISTLALGQELKVDKFLYLGPYSVASPFMVDSVDVNSKAFEMNSFLDFTPSFRRLWESGQTLETLPVGSDSNEMHLAAFIVENRMYSEVELKVDGLEDYRLCVDGKPYSGAKLSLEPASHKVTIQYLSQPGDGPAPQLSLSKLKGGELSIGVSGARMYTLEDVIHGTRIGGVEISPDGKFLIVSYRISKPGGKTDRISKVTEIATGRTVAQSRERLEWMPSSSKFYFEREDADGRKLVACDPVTGTEEILADCLPQGFYFMAPTEDYLIYMLTQEGPKEREDVYEVIHPDDRQPLWRERSYLAKYDLSTGMMQRLTFGYRNMWLNDISGDGRYLLFSVISSRLTSRPTSLTTLYMLDLQTLETETLVAEDGFIRASGFSPDGNQIVVGGGPEAFDGIGQKVKEGQIPNEYDGQLFLMDLSTKSVTSLTKDFDPAVTDFQWSKADGNVYFTAEDRDCVHLFRVDGKSHEITQVDVGEEVIKGFSLAQVSQTLAVYGESASNCERLYSVNTKSLKTTLLHDLHAEQMSEIEFGECLPWDFVNSRGDTICGRYYLPPHFDASVKYPMIVNYYGGCSPTSRDFEGRYPHHAYAALGYVVYIVEPSGATGFGQEFSARHVNTAGDYVADDIIEGVKKFCEEHPFVDASRVGCIGASYGGFMTQYLQTKTDIFAAAISHAGISDHTSYWGEGYWGYSYSEVSMADSYPWSETDLYVSHSPLYNVDKIHTPILFLHGDADHNVPVGESIQMYTALKLLGRETAMVLVRDQDHHILDYEKRIRWQSTIFAWFAKWLQGDDSWWESMYAKKTL